MKASVNKITQDARLRDCTDRCITPVIRVDNMSAQEFLDELYQLQFTKGVDHVAKQHVVLTDGSTQYVLMYHNCALSHNVSLKEVSVLVSRLPIEGDVAIGSADPEPIKEGDEDDN